MINREYQKEWRKEGEGNMGETKIGIDEQDEKLFKWKYGQNSHNPQSQPEAVQNEMRRPVKKILIIDDEPTTILLLKVRLAQNEYHIVAAEDGHTGYEKIKKEHPDLIILDVMLPGMGGFEICTKLKIEEELRHIPIIMLSARCGDIDQKMGFDCGTDAYFSKPCDVRALIKKVQWFLDRGEG